MLGRLWNAAKPELTNQRIRSTVEQKANFLFSIAAQRTNENSRLQTNYSEKFPNFCINFDIKRNFTFEIRGNWNQRLKSRGKEPVIRLPHVLFSIKNALQAIHIWHETQEILEIIPMLTTKLLHVVIATGISWNFMVLNGSLPWYKVKCNFILLDVCRINYNGNKIMCQEALASANK